MDGHMDPSSLHYHGMWQPRFGKSAKILGHCWLTNHTFTQTMRLETHPEWITHLWHTYTRRLTTFICNGWAYGFITTPLSWQVAAMIFEISQNPRSLLAYKPYIYRDNEA